MSCVTRALSGRLDPVKAGPGPRPVHDHGFEAGELAHLGLPCAPFLVLTRIGQPTCSPGRTQPAYQGLRTGDGRFLAAGRLGAIRPRRDRPGPPMEAEKYDAWPLYAHQVLVGLGTSSAVTSARGR